MKLQNPDQHVNCHRLVRPELFSLLICSVWCLTCSADESPTGDRTESAKKNWTEDVRRSAERIDVYPNAESDAPLQMVAAYKWSNPARPKIVGDRLCLIFIHEGRPVASCKVYPTGRSIVHAFAAFTDLELVAREGDAAIWTPPQSAPTFQKFDDVAPPHASAGRRRIQIKSLARQFTAETGDGEVERQSTVPELRLLPKELFRYAIKDEGQDGCVDGSLFCFVANGGNPQLLLQIEAVRSGDAMYWQYGFSRRTLGDLKAFHQQNEVYSVKAVARREMISTSAFFKTQLAPTQASD